MRMQLSKSRDVLFSLILTAIKLNSSSSRAYQTDHALSVSLVAEDAGRIVGHVRSCNLK